MNLENFASLRIFINTFGIVASLVASVSASAKDPYTIVFIPDTQYIMRPIGDVPTWIGKITEWVKTERAAYDLNPATGTNIRAVVHLGDMCDNGGEPSLWFGEPTLQEWQTRANEDLRPNGIAFVPVLGNHDTNPTGCESDESCADTYRTYFGGAFLTGQTDFVEATTVADGTPYGHDTGTVFLVPTGNGADRLAVVTGEWHRTATMESIGDAHRNWLGRMLTKYSGYPSIISMHLNVQSSDSHTTCRKIGNTHYFHDEFDLHPNLVMVINGHDIFGANGYTSSIPGDELNFVWSCNQERASSVAGFKYAEVMTNFQLIDTVYGTSGTGDGLLRIVEFDEDSGTMQHSTCSPDTILNYCYPGARDNFTVQALNFAAIRASGPTPPPPSVVPLLTSVGLLGMLGLIGLVSLRGIRHRLPRPAGMTQPASRRSGF